MKNKFNEYQGYLVFGAIALALLFLSAVLPESFNVFISKYSAIVTLATAFITYKAWSNTKKIIAQREMAKVTAGPEDVIVAISMTHQDIKIEQSITNSASPDLQKLIREGTPVATNIPDSEGNLLPASKYVQLRISESIKRCFLITGNSMPCDSREKMSAYITDFRRAISWLYNTLNNEGCQKIHLFIAAPVELSAFIMPYFINKITVIAYHWDIESSNYIQIGVVDERSADTHLSANS